MKVFFNGVLKCVVRLSSVFGAFYLSLSDIKSLKIQEFLMAAVMFAVMPE